MKRSEIKRRKPMARTRFLRLTGDKTPAKREAPHVLVVPPSKLAELIGTPKERAKPLTGPLRYGHIGVVDDGFRIVAPKPKHEYMRSPALMRAYRTLRCQHCGSSDRVFGAHSNWAIHGKGKSIKADDNRCASLCWACHTLLDQGSWLTEQERKLMWWFAHVLTVESLTRDGSWPASVPVPDIEHNPFAADAALPGERA